MIEVSKRSLSLYSLLIIFCFFIFSALALWSSTFLRIDISADAVALKRDLQSSAYQKVNMYFQDGDQLLLMINNTKPFKHIKDIEKMVGQLEHIQGVDSAYAITNVPLLFSPKLHLFQLMFKIPTLLDTQTDLSLAQKELTNSPFYQRLFLNKANNLTSILITLTPEKAHISSNNRRYAELNYLKTQRSLTPLEQQHYLKAQKLDQTYKQERQSAIQQIITDIEHIMTHYSKLGELYLLGIPTISQTIMHYLKTDLFYFGWLSLAIMAIMLSITFKRPGIAVLALLTSIMVVVLTAGLVRYLGWTLTIVSTNFPPILFVITLTFVIYLLLRFDELHQNSAEGSAIQTLSSTLHQLKTPIFYSASTTVVGFLSLTLCDIQPIIDFGYIMSIGIPIAYITCFIFLPAARFWLPWPTQHSTHFRLQSFFYRSKEYKKTMITLFIGLTAFFAWGCQYIQVENRFIDYFTYEGTMVKSIKLVDQELAGSSTLDVLLTHPKKNHWLKSEGVATLKAFHAFLYEQPEINKVLSIYTMTETLNLVHGSTLSPSLLKFSLNGLQPKDQSVLLKPYLTDEGRLARVVIYLPDSNPKLKRDQLLKKLDTYLKSQIKKPSTYQITGLYWLYNNVLQSLVNAQINILMTVYCLIAVMLLCLFRDIRLMCCALLPNLLPLSLVFGSLGWLGISLDFMTITIAAISLGLSIDFAIQFIYRMQFHLIDKKFEAALKATYDTVGYAIITTTLTLMTGFIVMLFSYFKPLVYFSLLSGLSILTACLTTLTLLPIALNYIHLKRPLTSQ